MRPEEVLMLALAAAVARIHPRDGLTEIRRRAAFDKAMQPLTEQGLLIDHTKEAVPGATGTANADQRASTPERTRP